MVSGLIESKGLTTVFDGVELQYTEHFWEFLAAANLWGNVPDKSFGILLNAFPNQIPRLLGYQQVVNRYDALLTGAMLTNARISAEAIIGAFAVKDNEGKCLYLPQSFSNAGIDQIMLSYLGGTPPEINLNHVRVLASWPSGANGKYNPSPEVRVTAQRRARSLEKEIFPDPNAGVHFGSGVQFSPEQRACKKATYEDGILNRTFGLEWLQKYTDHATVLNNFLYVFDFVGRDGILNCSSHKRTASTLQKIMGLHPHDEYQMTLEARMENMAVPGEILLYEKLLLENETRLENAIEWFFNDYIKDEFEVEGFSISLPTEETSWLDKCKAIGPEIERALKAFKLYAENGAIDTGYFPYVTIKDFREVPSLLDRKYLVEGEEFGRPANLLLSDKSPLAHSPTHPKDGSGFYRLVTRSHLTENDFHEIYHPQLMHLINNGFAETDNDGVLHLTLRAHLIALMWRRGAARLCDFAHYSEQVEKLASEKVIAYSDTLFSPDEADYLSYLLNNAKFSNALALRNKYDHGSGSVSDLSEKEMISDYCLMLAALIGLVLKINEELSYTTGKGGLDTHDLVDWPLLEE
ncbi:hypothetical protein HMPREF1868_00096 [Olsenella sp. DNF00959]|nr:hypothetical protein HMPREF1868_00096 [Olsenella sp. DNF00959]